MKYHSALKSIKYFESLEETNYFKIKDSVAFHHDVINSDSLPKEQILKQPTIVMQMQ